MLVIVVVPAAAFDGAGGLPSIGGISASRLPQDTLIYDRKGSLLADIGEGGNHRIVVPLSRISPLLTRATIAIEDRSFYHNPGIDIGGILRAAVTDFTDRRIVEGGSTITQQLVKQLFIGPRPPDTFQRKLREAMLALAMTAHDSKSEILDLYMNTIYYGDQAYGAEAAAETYFDTSARDLTLSQAAMLAGLPQAPTANSPVLHPRQAKRRQREVLQAMVSQRNITPEQSSAAATAPLSIFPQQNMEQAPHFVDFVEQVMRQSLQLDPAAGKGYRVYTSLDLGLQQKAEAAVRQQVARAGSYYGFHDGSLVSLDPRSGEVLALVGGADYAQPGGQMDMALLPRQPGSAFKLFTYTAAIEQRVVNMVTPILDAPLAFPSGGGPDGRQPYVPHNYDRRFHGMVPAELALGNSLNIPALKVELKTGISQVVEEARSMGVTSLTQPAGSYGMSLTLGGYPVSVLDMATGAATLADLGVRHRPAAVLRVTDAAGRPLYTYEVQSNAAQVVSPPTAFIMGAMLSDDRNRCLEFGCGGALTLPGRQVAAKTGTTENFRDNWTVGYTPTLATAVWVGNPDNQTMAHYSTGIVGAAPIWHMFMLEALQGTPKRWFQPPAGLDRLGADYFLPGTERLPSITGQAGARLRR